MAELIANIPVRRQAYLRNAEASAQINRGEPCVYVMNGTNDGKDIVAASTGGAVKSHTLLAGVALEDIAAGKKGRVQISGLCESVTLVRQTRAASTNSYQTYPAVALGDALFVATAANGFSRSGAGAANQAQFLMGACDTLASAASQASTSSDTSTRITSTIKAFLRTM
jgi:hypothetical protein